MPDFPPILREVSIHAKLHQKVDIVSFGKARIQLSYVGVVEVEMAFD